MLIISSSDKQIIKIGQIVDVVIITCIIVYGICCWLYTRVAICSSIYLNFSVVSASWL
jgi:hypothetical protein